MRIGQLARKLDIPPSTIITYLEELGIEMDKGVNTKLVQAGIERVMDEFGKIEMEDTTTSKEGENVPKEIISKEITEPTVEDENLPTKNIEIEEESLPIVEKEQEEITTPKTEEVVDDKTEVIRPEYVKLQGLKVVDKIELPTPKVVEKPKEEEKETQAEDTKIKPISIKEEVKEEESHIITEEQIKADLQRHYNEERKKYKTKKPQPKRKKRSPVSYEQKLEKEKKQEEKLKIEKENKKKALKTKKYKERMKNVQPAPIKKTKPKKKETTSFPVKEKYKKTPTTTWGKFMKWLNT
ncbi:MAG: hypothetical protein OEW67_12795 [Cyclobacteriaceae bacterium]|nr:hypothetical protein [Cyclobacteriaceae bacterium]